ncbi:LacI family transcriptional regulator [Motilibacter rhizosphaerae]|uniref:LacI family transcriptional regulator n=1 Tax=Motilibacter rhizosphaerae TaxID=598652 RepID=A0A4Q7NQ11_9ACTN|nr:LacI family DNA-binding transcriptional regulator [Motilibacter rhizosphaerae]RZS87192.1 LacI family transcriptional regulator [Motilibacter rhizosphaerae]
MPRRPTSADVAREAGVSRATVSYVLNDTPHQSIPEVTRTRVRDAAARLGYAPSVAARVLRRGRSDVVLALLPDWPIGPSVGTMLTELSAALAADGLTLVAHPYDRAGRPAADIAGALGPACVVVLDALAEEQADALEAAGIALVQGLLSGPGDVERRVGRAQVEHLLERGAARLAYAWPADVRVTGFARERLAGVRAAAEEAGTGGVDVREVALDPAAAATAVAAWTSGRVGVCAYNDEVALAVLAGLRVHGARVPAGALVVGVDDVPAAALAVPALSTVAVDLGALAGHLADAVAAALGATRTGPTAAGELVRVVARATS